MTTLSNPQTVLLVRLRLMLLAMLGGLLLLGLKFWQMQMIDSPHYANSQYRQSMRQVRLPGQRGRIVDRHGVCLADNRPSYCVAIYVEELRQPGRIDRTVDRVDAVVRELSRILGQPIQATRKEIAGHLNRRRPLPFLAWKDVDERALARLSESSAAFPGTRDYLSGVDVYVEPVRTYPKGALAAHVLGFVGRADIEQTPDESFDYYIPEMEGKQGIEKIMDQSLRGEVGAQLIRVDASGFRHEDKKRKDPIPGEDVILALDARIQALAEEALVNESTGEAIPGAVVVMDPRNGDILAMASAPTFDPNALGTGVSAAEWKALTSDGRKVLLNRAIGEVYAPGSVFKPLVALAALQSGAANGGTTFACPGYFQLGTMRIDCWKKPPGHGELAMVKALEQSCNAYFCQLGRQEGYDQIYQMAASIGLGSKSGIQLTGEATGILPNDAWKRRVLREGWRAGDTCNISIGQGAVAVTPLQMAQLAAVIANGGWLFRPRLVLHDVPVRSPRRDAQAPWVGDALFREGELVTNLKLRASTLSVVREGMHAVVQSPEGTGKRARVPGIEMAAKTGTAEFGRKGEGNKHAWMIAFAPYDKPRYAAVVTIEDAGKDGSGGRTAAPRMKKLMAGIFGISLEPEVQAPPLPASEVLW